MATSPTFAQNAEFTQNSGGSTAMTMRVPLGTYPGRGISLPVTLHYSSQGLWRVGFIKSVLTNQPSVWRAVTEAIYAEHSIAGWTTSLDIPKVEWPKLNDRYWFDGKPYPRGYVYPYTYRVARVYIHMPDGSTHELRKADQIYQDNNVVDMTGTFYAVDGSRMRYDSTGQSTGTLFLPDGTRYVLSSSAVQYIDRNGNMLNYNRSTRQWTDTVNRVISSPWPENPGAGDYSYSLPGFSTPYTLKFRGLSAALSPGSPAQMPMSDYYLPQPYAEPNNQGDTNFPQPIQAASLFMSAWLDEDNPSSYTYVVGRGQSGAGAFDPVVLAEIVLPNGQSYKFSYNNYGELSKVIYPTGAYQRYDYSQVPTIGWVNPPYPQGTRGLTSRWISPNGTGTDEAQWQIVTSPGVDRLLVSVTAPNGTRSETHLLNPATPSNNFSYQDARAGMPIEERVYAPATEGGAMLRRSLTEYAQSSRTYTRPSPGSGTYTAWRNARPVKTVSMVLDTGGNALANASTTLYDPTFEFSVGLDATSTTEYNYAVVDQSTAQTGAIASIPLGQKLRTTQTMYLTSDANYRNLNILGLVSSVTILNGFDQVVAQTAMGYDEGAYPLLTYGAVSGWTHPGTSYRGNLTTTYRWLDNPVSAWIQSHTQYDQCGNIRKIQDALSRESEIQYTDSYSDGTPRNNYAYPTLTITPIPDPLDADPAGTHGYPSALTANSVYDFNTGLVVSTTDANGNITSFEYNDALMRPTKVNRPDGSWTTTGYSDTPGNIYVRTQTLQDATPTQRVIDTYQYFDKLGRASRSFLKEGATYLTSDTHYDSVGRLWRVSNPYRTSSMTDPVNPSNLWTTSTYDALNRVIAVTTPDGAQALTAYGGSTSGTAIGASVTVTDQTAKSRTSISDAGGRLIRLIEAPGNSAYETNYAYDVLDNLRRVEQGAQLRYFGYDSLSRLIRVRSVEQTINPALNWTDPVTGYTGWTAAFSYWETGSLQSRTDARNITTYYTYDNLSRVTTVRYTNDPQNTPGVDYFYDGYVNGSNQGVNNSKGQLFKVLTAGQTAATVDAFDVLGRATVQRQQFYINGQWSQPYNISRTFDRAGHVKTQTYPSGHMVTYNYDQAGRLGDKDTANLAFTGYLGDGAPRTYSRGIAYSTSGGISEEQLGTTTPVYNKRFYNVRGQLAEIRVSTTPNDTWWNRGAIINHYSDQCWGMCAGSNMTDNNGNVKRQEVYIPANDSITSWTLSQDVFTYDTLNRLQSATENSSSSSQGQTPAWQQNFEYDRWGNRTSAVTAGSAPGGMSSTSNRQTRNMIIRKLPSELLQPVNSSTYVAEAYERCQECDPGFNEPPEAYPGGPYSAQTHAAIQFNGTGSYDPDGWITDYSWNFGDGQTASGPTPVHSYSSPGTFTVTLTVRDNGNLTNTSSTTATITSQGPATFNNAAFISQSVPTSMTAGQTYNVSVTMKNTGTSTWSASTAHRLGSQSPQDNGTWGIGRVELSNDVGMNGYATFNFSITAPTGQGVYDFQWRMVQESVEWFGDYSPNIQVTVTAAQQPTQLVVDPATNRVYASNGTIGYDNAGNITNDSYSGHGGRTYDAENRMTAAQDATGGTSYYGYDGNGKRVRRVVGTVETWAIYGFGGELIAEYGANVSYTAPQKEYGYRNGQLLIAAEPNANIRWLVADQLGTPRMVLDASGSLTGVSRHDYMPFGEELYAGSGGRTGGQGYTNTDGARQKFTGYEADTETALNFAQARYHSPALGRFTSVDPLEGVPLDPQSFNHYAYTNNNPTNKIDPTGLAPFFGAEYGWNRIGWYYGARGSGMRVSRHIFQGLVRHDLLRTTGYDTAFGRFWGDVQINVRYPQNPSGVTGRTYILHNPTGQQVINILNSELATVNAIHREQLNAAIRADTVKQLEKAGLDDKVILSPTREGFTFTVKRGAEDDVKDLLEDPNSFKSGGLYRKHMDDAKCHNGGCTDYRSPVGMFGERSLQVVYNSKLGIGWADTDVHNPYQFPSGTFGHLHDLIYKPEAPEATPVRLFRERVLWLRGLSNR